MPALGLIEMRPLILVMTSLIGGCATNVEVYDTPCAIGRVVDAQTGAALTNARVSVKGKPEVFAETDRGGSFTLLTRTHTESRFKIFPTDPVPPPGTVLVTSPGYLTKELQTGACSRLVVPLERGQ